MSDQDLYSLVSKDSQSDILASLPEEPTKKHSSSSSSKSKHHNTAKKSSTKKTMKKEPSIWNKYSLKRKYYIFLFGQITLPARMKTNSFS